MSIDHRMLYDTFSMFGEIIFCKLALDTTGESKGYGFVHYRDPKAAAKAIEKVNNMKISNKKVTVEKFKSRSERSAKQTWTNVVVNNLPTGLTQEQFKKAMTAAGGEGAEIDSLWGPFTDERYQTSKGMANYKTME